MKIIEAGNGMTLSALCRIFSRSVIVWGLAFPALADDALLRPYVLSSNVQGDMVKTVIELKEALTGGGFQLLGEYSPVADRHVLVVTNAYLKRLARQQVGTLFAVPQRIGISRVEGKIQVAYTNPAYQQHAFRISGDLEPVRLQLKRILGEQETFGAEGLSATALASYRYASGMEQFDDFLHLGRFGSHARALAAVERGLAARRGGIGAVFRIDLDDADTTLFGLSLTEGEGSDRAVISAVDIRPLKHTPRFPYTLVVRQGAVFVLHPRFRLPLDFPDLERTGRYSFTAMIRVPGAIENSLRSLLDGS
ncbi:hypothetical protein [Sedimenticola hydrogenitrophicus]|uniref:hypothetical protein n=1 Tax=Sedimenticola hydrogenitrophicus TaxID=2967975 RepID=UPI0021A7A72B|nr:hypothetical protein [Sedimenticola hydrogenitrophicus]